jgi:nicotinamide-nucleotide amidase
MRAAILSIGSELMHGFLTDTNATFLSQELNALGIEVVGVFQVGDDLARIVSAFRRALDDADLIVATGGIGPTDDDLTREAVSAIRGEQPLVDQQIADRIRRFFTSRGVTMPEQNVKQAWMIPSAESLVNPMGTAPGWFVCHEYQMIVVMPGVPREMYRMWREQATPRILPRLDGHAIVSRTLKTIGIGESAVEREIIAVVRRGFPTVATYAKDDGVHIRITAVSASQVAGEQAVDDCEREIRAAIGSFVYGYLDDSIASSILAPIAQAGRTAAIWEAGSAGLLSVAIEESPLADAVVVDARTSSFASARDVVGATDDALDVAERCAREVATRTGAGVGIAIAVRIRPGTSADRSTGDIALAFTGDGSVSSRQHTISTNPAEIRRRATMWALDFLWTGLRDATAGRRN